MSEQKSSNQASIIIPMDCVKRIIIEPVNNNNHVETSNKLQTNFKSSDKYIYTCCILLIYLNYGINNVLFPSTMEDMKYLFRTTLTKLNYAETFAVIGYLLGSLCGLFYNHINRQLTFVVMVSIQGVFIAIMPMTQSLWQFYLAFMMWELGGAAFDSGNAVWIIEMWKEKAPSVLQLSHMMYGLGAILGPLIAEPYIMGDLSENNITAPNPTIPGVNITGAVLNRTIAEDINYSVDRRSNLRIPYMIGGGSTLIIPIVLLVMFFVKKYKTPEKQTQTLKKRIEDYKRDDTSEAQPSEMTIRTRNVLIVLMALLLMSYNCLEVTFITYSSTFYECLKISAPKAVQLMSIFSAAFTLGRLLSAYISSKLRADTIIIYHIIIILVSLGVLYFGQHSESALYVGMALIGLGFSAMWPCFFAFAEHHIRLTDKITSIFSFVSMMLFLVSPFIISPLIESHPDIFLYVEFAYFAIVITLFIIIMLILKASKRNPIIYTINS